MFTNMSASGAIPAPMFFFSTLGIVITRFQLKFEEDVHLLRKMMYVVTTIFSAMIFLLAAVLSFSGLGKNSSLIFLQNWVDLQETTRVLIYFVSVPLFAGVLISIGYKMNTKYPEER